MGCFISKHIQISQYLLGFIISGKKSMIHSKIYQRISHSKICIIGCGTGGLNLSTHLLRAGHNPKDMRIFEAAQKHYYQPGWTMLGADMCKTDLTWRPMSSVIPKNILHTKQNVARVNAEQNQIITQSGQKFHYDQLIFSSGLKYDWQKIKGAKEALDNPNSKAGTIYEMKYAEKLAKVGRQFRGGKAIFTEPLPPIKCAGSPQKVMYLWASQWQKAGISAQVNYLKPQDVMFGVPKYSEALASVAARFGINVEFKHNLVQIKPNDVAVFKNLLTDELVEKPFDFLHFIPPMSAHTYIAESGLADAAGYLDVDKFTLRHNKYSNIWGLGDCTSTPNSKTAAAAFSQTQVLVKNLKTALANPNAPLPDKYEGYASCPLFVGNDRLMLAEFKYGGIPDQTFFKDQQRPRKAFFWLKKYGFPYIYWYFVPKGLWGGRRGIKIDI